jgi:hypothetical protein
VGQDRDVGQPGLLQGVDAGRGLGHLHQGQDVLLHARAAGRRNRHQRHPEVDRQVAGPHELLADGGAHRAAQEGEVHDREDARVAVDGCRAHDHRVVETGRGLRGGQAVDVRLEIGEGQRVGRADLAGRLPERVLVGQLGDPLERSDREVVTTGGAHPQGSDELLVAVVRAAHRTGVRVARLGRRGVRLRLLAAALDLDVDVRFGAHRCGLQRLAPSPGRDHRLTAGGR